VRPSPSFYDENSKEEAITTVIAIYLEAVFWIFSLAAADPIPVDRKFKNQIKLTI
jgi:hypothetical protein